MIANGHTWLEVVNKLYPNAEYPNLLAALTCERFRSWYRRQTPQRLMEALQP